MSRTSFLWVTDPWEKLIHPKETTLRLMQRSAQLGYSNYWCDAASIRLVDSSVLVTATKVLSVTEDLSKDTFGFSEDEDCSPTDFGQIHYRVDPPVDHSYSFPLQLLAMAARTSNTEIVNSAESIFAVNEKTEGQTLGALFGDALPTLVTSSEAHLKEFYAKHGETVLKPLFDARGRGIEKFLPGEDSKYISVVASLTDNFRVPIMAQKFLPKIHEGELRLWFNNGELLVAMKKYPDDGSFKVNVTGGSRIERVQLSKEEDSASQVISKKLKELRIRLAAVDLIGGVITDFNITSPGLLVQLEQLYGEDFAEPTIQALSRKF